MQGQAHRLNHSTRPLTTRGASEGWGSHHNVGGSYCTRWCTLAGVVCILLLSAGCGTKSVSAAPAPPAPVQVAEVAQRDVPIYHEYIATLDGYVNAQIQPQVSGYLIKQNYREGALVRKNEVLFNIDPRPFQAVLDQAKAQLAQAEAQLGKTQLDVQRDTPLAREKAIAQSQLDNDARGHRRRSGKARRDS